jgi:hypothetical protein
MNFLLETTIWTILRKMNIEMTQADTICNLCKENKPLIKKSHIIPDFMYQGLFCDKHFIVHTTLDNLDKSKKIPHGIYDGNILCAKCDNEVIGSLESYASKVLFGGTFKDQMECPDFTPAKSPEGLVSLQVQNINYEKFKLFLLSILWRSHLSKHKFFKDVNLGSHAETIRKMIIDNDPKEEDVYETAVVNLNSKEIPVDSLIAPRYLKRDGNSFYVFLINKFLYHFNISSYNKQSLFDKGRINKDNTMEIGVLQGEFANGYFDSYIGNNMRLRTKKH